MVDNLAKRRSLDPTEDDQKALLSFADIMRSSPTALG